VRQTTRIEVNIMNNSDVEQKLSFMDKFQLAQLGYLDTPPEQELVPLNAVT